MSRNWRFRHTGLIGRASRAQSFIRSIDAPSLTEEGRCLVAQIDDLLEQLQIEIRARRVEPDGSIKEMTT